MVKLLKTYNCPDDYLAIISGTPDVQVLKSEADRLHADLIKNEMGHFVSLNYMTVGQVKISISASFRREPALRAEVEAILARQGFSRK